MRAVRAAAAESGREPLLIANAYDADPGSPIARTLIERNKANVLQGVAIAAHAIGAVEAIIYLHPEADAARSVMEQDIEKRREGLGALVVTVALGTALGAILDRAGGVVGELKAIHVGGPTGGLLAASKRDVRFGFDELKAAGTHMGSAQVRAITTDTCVVGEAAKMFAYLAKETCGICVPCRVGTARVQGILESVQSQLGRESDVAWLGELGDHMEKFSLCGFGITAPSILRTTMTEFAADYQSHIKDQKCPNGTCAPIRARRYETMAQP